MELLEKIEGEFSSLVGLKDGVLVRSGTVALWLALEALQLPPGSRVALSPVVCPQVLAAINLARLNPVFIDISPINYGIDPVALSSVDGLSAIIAIHAFGIPCQIAQIAEIGRCRGIPIIEDACLNYGLEDRPLGGHSDMAIISFGNDKLISAGGGGMVLSGNLELISRLREIRAQNLLLLENSLTILNAIHSGLSKMRSRAHLRKKRSLKYCDQLRHSFNTLSPEAPLWRFPLVLRSDRAEAIKKARSCGLFISTHYHPLHFFVSGVSLPVTEQVSKGIINLPLHERFSDEEINRYIHFVRGL